jgi:hypothetical protein
MDAVSTEQRTNLIDFCMPDAQRNQQLVVYSTQVLKAKTLDIA